MAANRWLATELSPLEGTGGEQREERAFPDFRIDGLDQLQHADDMRDVPVAANQAAHFDAVDV